jgi:hypothetical protein
MSKRKRSLEDRIAKGDKAAFKECLSLMKASAPPEQEAAFHLLLAHCILYIPELVETFRGAKLSDYWICELVVATKSPLIIPVLLDCVGLREMGGEAYSCRTLALLELIELVKKHGTKEARQLLWDLNYLEPALYRSEEDEDYFEFHRRFLEIGEIVDPERVDHTAD